MDYAHRGVAWGIGGLGGLGPDAIPVRLSKHASPRLSIRAACGTGAYFTDAKFNPCHSREGGNPFGGGNSRGTMDYHLRGNDSFEATGYCVPK